MAALVGSPARPAALCREGVGPQWHRASHQEARDEHLQGSSRSVCMTTHVIAEEAEAWEGSDLARQGYGGRGQGLGPCPEAPAVTHGGAGLFFPYQGDCGMLEPEKNPGSWLAGPAPSSLYFTTEETESQRGRDLSELQEQQEQCVSLGPSRRAPAHVFPS